MRRHKIAFTLCLGLALMLVSSAALAQYQVTNLDSNQAKTAKFMDPMQVNGWGLAYGPGGPFWVSDQGSGWSTLYNSAGVKQGLEVLIPSASGAVPLGRCSSPSETQNCGKPWAKLVVPSSGSTYQRYSPPSRSRVPSSP